MSAQVPMPTDAVPAEPTPPTPTTTTTTEPTKTSDEEAEPSLLNQKAEAKAPEKYEAFTAPEGFELDEDSMTAAQAMFKKFNLSQENAQELVSFYISKAQEAMEAPVKYWDDMRTQWVNEIKADPEIGNKLDEVRTTVSRTIDSVLGAQLGLEFKKAMDFTGAGNNPAFIRGFYKLAQALGEGTAVKAGRPSPGGQSRPGAAKGPGAGALYPDLPSASGG